MSSRARNRLAVLSALLLWAVAPRPVAIAESRDATRTATEVDAAPARPEAEIAAARAALIAVADTIDHVRGRASYDLRTKLPPAALRSLWRTARLAANLIDPSLDLGELTDTPPVLADSPVAGALSSPFGYRRDPISGRRIKHHKGLDFVAERGTTVHAAGPGLVVEARRRRGYGRVVYIDHGLGVETRYAHLQSIRVRAGDYLPRGAVIGTVGSSGRATGPHLHFEVRIDGEPVDPSSVVDDLDQHDGERDGERDDGASPRRRRNAT